jgi:hypothetical protein
MDFNFKFDLATQLLIFTVIVIFILFLIGLICGLIFGEHNIFYPLFTFLIISFAVSYANNKNN